MSTSIEHIVDLEASLEEAAGLAERVVRNLMARGIILETPQLHPLLDEGPRYAIGPQIHTVARHNDCFPCGLNVEIGRAVFTPGENGLETLQCPACGQTQPADALGWSDAVSAWYDHNTADELTCPVCGHASPVTEWRFEPTWGFGNLAFAFTECFLADSFLQEMGQLLGHRIAWVKSHW